MLRTYPIARNHDRLSGRLARSRIGRTATLAEEAGDDCNVRVNLNRCPDSLEIDSGTGSMLVIASSATPRGPRKRACVSISPLLAKRRFVRFAVVAAPGYL